jgi:hypothetical protein
MVSNFYCAFVSYSENYFYICKAKQTKQTGSCIIATF